MLFFGRQATPDVEHVLLEMLNSSTELRALARNLMHDYRVTAPREAAARAFFTQPLTAEAFGPAIRAYKSERVRASATPDFVEDELNGPNILAGSALGEHQISKDLYLGRVLNLSTLVEFFKKARTLLPFCTLTDGSSARIKDWVNEQMVETNWEAFIEDVLENLWPNKNADRAELCWATTWNTLEAVADEEAHRWAEVVGIPVEEGDWLILLRYPVRRTGTLVRPTQLDAGWNALHFPSPPTTPLTSGGHPMDLGDGTCHASIRSEFIHQQITHK
ncbi:MAG: hypothetical protein QOE82_1652, partial [Thermoanaerobaculia bacterium]|nr:hypothetical protein [Thermoanaerobaculia bacterium]